MTTRRHYRLLPALLIALVSVLGLAATTQAQAAPRINNVVVTPAVLGVRLIIEGSGFASYNIVQLSGAGGSVSTPAASLDGFSLAVSIPSPAAAEATVTIVNAYGTSNTFPVTLPPGPTPSSPPVSPVPSTPPIGIPPTGVLLTSLTPPTASPGTRVTLTGAGFGSANTVTLASASGTVNLLVASLSDQSLVFTVPTTVANGVYQVTVTSYRGTSNALPLTITGSSPPLPTPSAPPSPTTLTYVALGDSIARGFFGFFSYVNHFRTAIEQDTGAQVTLDNRSQSGWTSAQLQTALQTDLELRTAVSRADIITWNIGGNNLRNARDRYRRQTCGGADNQDCLRQMASAFKQNWDAIVTEIIAVRPPQQSVVRTMDIYYPYVTEDSEGDSWPNDAGSDFAVLTGYVQDVNNHIAASTSIRGIPLAPVYRTYNGSSGNEDPKNQGYITFDGFHPSTRGQQVIADLLRGLGYSPRQ